MADEPEAATVEVDRSIDATMDRAFEKAFAVESPTEKPSEDAPSEEGPARGPDGKFIAKDAADAGAEPEPAPAVAAPEAAVEAAPAVAAPEPIETPAWLADPAAKAAWTNVPAPVQAQVSRRIGELENGLTQYRQRYEPLAQFDDMARQSGTDLASALASYTGIEQALRSDPIGGLNSICQNLGLDLRQVAAHVMGQPFDQNQQTQAMQQEISRLRQVEQQFHSFQTAAQTKAEQEAQKTVEKFAADHPRFNELTREIGWALKNGLAEGLEDAYQYAERLKPAPMPPLAQTQGSAKAQTRKADISIHGAPGSAPVKPKSRNADEAIDRAFDQVGL
jgi:hypothetical protein